MGSSGDGVGEQKKEVSYGAEAWGRTAPGARLLKRLISELK
jgi:hypothetical protein